MIYLGSNYYNSKGVDYLETQSNITIVLKDTTTLSITNDDIMSGGLSLQDSVLGDNTFLGSAVMNQLTLILENSDNRFSIYDFNGARVTVKMSIYNITDNVMLISDISKGIFTVDKANVVGNSIRMECFDDMHKFDRPLNEVVLPSPLTLGTLLSTICAHCGVAYSIPSLPSLSYNFVQQDAITCREMIGYIAMMGGYFARINRFGELRLISFDMSTLNISNAIDGGVFDSGDPSYTTGNIVDGGDFTFGTTTTYDGGTFTDLNGYHQISDLYSNDIATEDVTLEYISIMPVIPEELGAEGEVITETPEWNTIGSGSYGIKIDYNPLIISNSIAITVATAIFNKIGNMTFRPMTISSSTDIGIEAGDVGFVVDKNNNIYKTIFMSVLTSIGSQQQIICDVESGIENESVTYSISDKVTEMLKHDIYAERINRQEAILNLSEELASSSGLYQTVMNDGGGNIYYMHNKPQLAYSDIIWKMSATAFGVSTDGGFTWNAGLTADGTAILTRIYAIGIDASYITTGTIDIDTDATIGNVLFLNPNNSEYEFKGIKFGYGINAPLMGVYSDGFLYTMQIHNTEYPSNSAISIKSTYVTLDSDIRIVLNSDDSIQLQASNIVMVAPHVGFEGELQTAANIICGGTGSNGYLLQDYTMTPRFVLQRSGSDNWIYLGSSTNFDGLVLRGNSVRLGSSSGTIVTSDERLKDDMVDIDQRYIDMFYKLEPITFKYKNHHRTHTGFGAQTLKRNLEEVGLTTEDFAGFVESPIARESFEEEYGFEPTFDTELGIRYEEFVGLQTKVIQEQKKEIDDLKARMEVLEQLILNR